MKVIMLQTFRNIFNFSQKRKGILVQSIIFNILHSIFDIMQFGALYLVIHALFDRDIKNAGLNAFILMVISVLGQIIMDYNSNLRQTKAGYFMAADKRIDIGERMKYMPMGYFNQNSIGNITAVATNLMSDVEYNAPKVLNTMVSGAIYTVVLAVVVVAYRWEIGLIMILAIMVYLLINYFMQKSAKELLPQRQEVERKMVEDVLEYIQGMHVVKAFHLGEKNQKKVSQSVHKNMEINLAIEKKFVPYMAIAEFVLYGATVAIFYVSIHLFLAGNIKIWDCILILIAAFYLFRQLMMAGSMSSLLRIMDASMEQVKKLEEVELMDIDGVDKKPKNLDISLKNVSFSYDNKQVIKNVSLDIPEKSTVAIVGHSGSGKTTLCNLITRFWDVKEGSITLGGEDIRSYTLDSLLDCISVVFQNVYLFEDTIANNIKFGKPDATMEEIQEAAKKACCHDFIMALPNKYDTIITEGGGTISGGEKQRISIARAILKNAPIIILDEATASVDPENENELEKAIEELTRNKTIIMIAHRLKTVRHADQIVVLEQGEIVERGTHEALEKENGIYAGFIHLIEAASGWKL